MQIINKRKYFYVLSGILITASILAISFWGLNFGIDFTGGTQMDIKFENQAPQKNQIEEKMTELGLESLSIQMSGDNETIIKYKNSDEKTNIAVFEKIKELDENAQQLSVDFIGASVSDQLKKSAVKAILLAIFGIAIYIAWAFRHISRPVKSWKYGAGAVLALTHDVIITVGAFAFFGEYFNIEVGVPFVAALLTILGYSVNDTIVVFDRTRENLLKSGNKDDFEEIVNRSLNETLARSINTSLTVILVLVAIIFFGGETIKLFSLALLIGVTFGTYSSIYVATALLVTIYKWQIKSRNA